MSILCLIASGNFISVNRDLIKAFGIETALLIGELASEYDYYSKRGELTDNCFYSTVRNINNNTGLSEHQQRQAFNILKENGIVEIVKKGLPARRYVKINEEVFLSVWDKWCKNYGTGDLKNKAQKKEKLKTNNNKENKNKKNNNIYNDEFEKLWKLYPRKQGKAKALQAYIKARKNGVEYETIKKGVENYSRYVENNRIEQEYIKHGSTWFNQQCWDDDYSVVEKEKRGNYTFGGKKESKSTWGCTGEASYDIEELTKIK